MCIVSNKYTHWNNNRWPEERRREAELQSEELALLGMMESINLTPLLYTYVIALYCVQIFYQG